MFVEKVVGEVGSGKTSLLASLFGELVKFQGAMNLNGTFSYVPQQAWLQNTSLKNNILFGRQLNEKLYDQVVSACALEADINLLPSMDSTEIGEKVIFDNRNRIVKKILRVIL